VTVVAEAVDTVVTATETETKSHPSLREFSLSPTFN
jgi:hypothetical protein